MSERPTTTVTGDGPVAGEDRIFGFRGRRFFLSNFFVEADGLTGEHRFQAAKAQDDEWRVRILLAPTPSKAKYWGRVVPLRPDWDDIKHTVMADVVSEKFRDPELRLQLFTTGDAELIEANGWGDRYWGTDLDGDGRNELGKILMAERARLLTGVIRRLSNPEQAMSVAPLAAAYLEAVSNGCRRSHTPRPATVHGDNERTVGRAHG